MEKKVVIGVGCVVLYILLSIITDGAIRIVLVLGLLGYGMYKFG